jgi:fluoroquinolone resistance protein
MEALSHEDKTFAKISYSGKDVKNRNFERCIFKDCDLSESNFSYGQFTDCTFTGCNLSMVKLGQTGLNNVVFDECKLLGINFHECGDFLFTVNFKNSVLDYSSFINKKMPKTKFKNCSLKEVVFANANLANSVFDNSDLSNAVFNGTQLKEADFRTALNYFIDPEINQLKKARFSLSGISGLLEKYEIIIGD